MRLLTVFLFCTLFSSPLYSAGKSEKWVVSSVLGSNLSEQSWATRLDFPQEYIREQWVKGKFITSLTYGDGLWNVVLSKGSGIQKQTWATRQEFPADLIKEKWAENLKISAVSYGQSSWAIVFSKHEELGPQTYRLSSTFPQEYIEEHWQKGYFVNSLVYGDRQWLVVMSKGDARKQTFVKSGKFPEDWIQEKVDRDLEITHTAFGDGYWVVLAGQEGWYGNAIYADQQFPKSSISNDWASGKAILNISYGYKPGIDDPIQARQNNNLEDKTEETINGPAIRLISVMDTDDRLLGLGAQQALKTLQAQFQATSKALNLPLVEYQFKGTDFKQNKVQTALENLKVGSDDILVFYYFGHGFRYSNHNSRFPICFVGDNGIDQPMEVGISLSRIYQTLEDKGARLNLIFAECCNNDIGVPAPIDQFISSRPMSVSAPQKDRYKSLFLGQTGSVLLASSDAGQASWATTTGGYFLDSFLDALHYQVSENNPEEVSWENLLKDAQMRTQRLAQAKNRVQEPIYSIKLQH